MLSHLMLGSNDLEQSRIFYDAVMGSLGYAAGVKVDERYLYFSDGFLLAITKPINGEPATYANGMTLGFKASSVEQVDAWHKAGVENGGVSCENPPGIRQIGERQLYLAYLRDPCGNKLCASYPITR